MYFLLSIDNQQLCALVHVIILAKLAAYIFFPILVLTFCLMQVECQSLCYPPSKIKNNRTGFFSYSHTCSNVNIDSWRHSFFYNIYQTRLVYHFNASQYTPPQLPHLDHIQLLFTFQDKKKRTMDRERSTVLVLLIIILMIICTHTKSRH